MKIFIIGIIGFGMSVFCETAAQSERSTSNRELIIRSGLTASAGVSQLHLDDALRPSFAGNDYFQFKNDPFMKVGAIVTVQPVFMGNYFQLVFDPSFSKFSWGNYHFQRVDTISNAMDIDVQQLEVPISLRYSFLPYSKTIQPFIRGGYSFSWLVDTEAQFQTIIYTEPENIDTSSSDFTFAKFQHALFLSGGVEFNLKWVDFTVELVLQKGEGIDNMSGGKNLMSFSNTTNYYLQFGVLF